jgi:hypothetical protein
MIGIHKGDAPDFRPTENVYKKPDLRGRNRNAAPKTKVVVFGRDVSRNEGTDYQRYV